MNKRSQLDQASEQKQPHSRPGQLGVMHAVEMSSYSGPLPHPDILRGFEEVVPGSAQRIFTQFEEQSAHRRAMEASVIPSGAFSQRIGSISASVIGLIGVGGGVWLTHEGKGVVGLTSLIGTLAALVGTYLYKRIQQDAERAEKRNGTARKKQ